MEVSSDLRRLGGGGFCKGSSGGDGLSEIIKKIIIIRFQVFRMLKLLGQQDSG